MDARCYIDRLLRVIFHRWILFEWSEFDLFSSWKRDCDPSIKVKRIKQRKSLFAVYYWFCREQENKLKQVYVLFLVGLISAQNKRREKMFLRILCVFRKRKRRRTADFTCQPFLFFFNLSPLSLVFIENQKT